MKKANYSMVLTK